MSILDLTDIGERQEQAFDILKKIHKSKAGQAMIHTEKCLTNSEGYDFACPICGATVEYDGTVNLPETKTKAQCQACGKQVKKEDLKEKILGGVASSTLYAVSLCSACRTNTKVLKVNHKRELLPEVAICDDCGVIFDSNTKDGLQALIDEHPHDNFKILQGHEAPQTK